MIVSKFVIGELAEKTLVIGQLPHVSTNHRKQNCIREIDIELTCSRASPQKIACSLDIFGRLSTTFIAKFG